MIIITGANGKLGRAIVNNLLERIPAEQIGVSVRDVSKANDLKELGVRVRYGDYEDPTSLANAFEGASQVLIVSASTTGEVALKQHKNAIEAAKSVGASRILYTSHMGSNPNSIFSDHAATEVMLKESGIPFTSLRNGFYASSILMFLGNALETGEFITPEDGPVSWTAHADLAEAAAIALVNEGSLDGLTPPLAPTKALDFTDIAAIVSDITGRSIKHITVSDEEYKKTMISYGMPEKQVDFLLGFFVASRKGELATIDPTFERLIGHSAITVKELLSKQLNKDGK